MEIRSVLTRLTSDHTDTHTHTYRPAVLSVFLFFHESLKLRSLVKAVVTLSRRDINC